MANAIPAITAVSGYNLGGGVGLQPFARWDSSWQAQLDAFDREAQWQSARAAALYGAPTSIPTIALLSRGAISGGLVPTQPRGIGVSAVPGEVDVFSLAQEDRTKLKELAVDPQAVPTRRSVDYARKAAAKSLRGGGLTQGQRQQAVDILNGSDADVVHMLRGGLVGHNQSHAAKKTAPQTAAAAKAVANAVVAAYNSAPVQRALDAWSVSTPGRQSRGVLEGGWADPTIERENNDERLRNSRNAANRLWGRKEDDSWLGNTVPGNR